MMVVQFYSKIEIYGYKISLGPRETSNLFSYQYIPPTPSFHLQIKTNEFKL